MSLPALHTLFTCDYLIYDPEINKFIFKQDMGDVRLSCIWDDYLKLLGILTNVGFPGVFADKGSYERFAVGGQYAHMKVHPIKSPHHCEIKNTTNMDVNFLYKLYLKAVGKRDENKNYREKVTEINDWFEGLSYMAICDYLGDEGQLAVNLNGESIIVGLLDDNVRSLIKLSMYSNEFSRTATYNNTISLWHRLKMLAFCKGLIDNHSTLFHIDIDIIPIIAEFFYRKAEGGVGRVPSSGGGKNQKRKYKRRKSKKRKTKRKYKRRKTKRK